MHYFIDGYNLLFRILQAGDDLAKKRQHIIEDLNRKIQLLGLDVTIVFDSHYRCGESERTHYNHLEIQFTNQGESADDFIINELKRTKNPRQETVVTSDNKLAWYARRKAAHSQSVEEFISTLNRRYKNKLFKPPLKPTPQPLLASVRKPKADVQPFAETNAQDCFDFYLNKFEMEFLEMIKNEKPKTAPKTPKKIKNPAKDPIPKGTRDLKYESDMHRWLDLFEKRLEE